MDIRRWLRAEWDRVAGFSLIGGGALLLIVGYHGVRTSAYVAQQLCYAVSGGMGGLFLLGLGVGLLISADLHDEWRKLDRIEAVLRGDSLGDPKALLELLRHSNGNGHETAAPAEPVGATRRRAQDVTAAVAVEPWSVTPPSSAGVVALDWKATGLRRGFGTAASGAVVAAVVLLAGWWRAAHATDVEIGWEGAALAGLGIVVGLAFVAGHGFWLRQRVAARTGRMFAALAQAEAASDGPSAPTGTPDTVIVAAGLRRYHRPGCPSLATVADARAVAQRDLGPHLEPCRICDPT